MSTKNDSDTCAKEGAEEGLLKPEAEDAERKPLPFRVSERMVNDMLSLQGKPPIKKDFVKFSTTIPSHSVERLRILAKKNGFSVSGYICNAVRKHMETDADPVPRTPEEMMEEAKKEYAREEAGNVEFVEPGTKAFNSLEECYENLRQRNERAALKYDKVYYWGDGSGQTYSHAALNQSLETAERDHAAGVCRTFTTMEEWHDYLDNL